MSERYPNCKRDHEASSASLSPFKKKKKLDDSSTDSHGVFLVIPSSSEASSDDSGPGRCSVTSAGEDDNKSSIICLNSESNEIARNSPSVVVDLEARQVSETETSTFISRKEVNPGSETTEMESSSASPTERDDRKSSPEVSKNPTPEEIEELLSELESKDEKRFIEKYNFDIVNDKPLQGRYKWDRFDP